MAKVILTIGLTQVLLPSSKGLATILTALEGAVEVTDCLYRGVVRVSDRALTLEAKIVPNGTRFLRAESESEEEVDLDKKPPTRRRALPGRPRQLLLEGHSSEP